MVHFYHRKFIRCWMRERLDNTCDQLNIEYEFSMPGQQDGHGPWHRDDARDFAECVIRNIDIDPIANCLSENGVVGFRVSCYGIDVKALNVLDPDCLMPKYLITIWFNLSREEDASRFLAQQLMRSIRWEVAKEAISIGRSTSMDWDYGYKGSVWKKKQELVRIAAEKLKLVTSFPDYPFADGLSELQNQMLDDTIRSL